MTTKPELIFSVSDFVSSLNQTLEFAYPSVSIEGELANFRVSKNKWIYFDLKDELASVRCFGTVYMLPGPLEDGMAIRLRGVPRMHSQYGFSVTVQSLQPVGEGAIRRASDLLRAKLAAEGLFDEERKRALPYPPMRIGLIASKESAAYADFIKILSSRWGGIEIIHVDVQVQGELAPGQVTRAIEQLNQLSSEPEIIVITRGGGSPDDLQAFSTEQVTRAVAASRIPTLVAIGHEVDISLAELAADTRASTPSNAAELLVPDRNVVLQGLEATAMQLRASSLRVLEDARTDLKTQTETMRRTLQDVFGAAQAGICTNQQLLDALNPTAILRRGYTIVRSGGAIVRSARDLPANAIVDIEFNDGHRTGHVE